MKTSIKSCFSKNLFKNKNTKSLFPLLTKRNFFIKNSQPQIDQNQIKKIQTKNFNFPQNFQRKNFCVNLNKINYSVELLLPNFDKFNMEFDENSTFKDISNSIQKNFKFENIEFRTWDHSKIALGNHLNSTLTSKKFVFLKIDTFEWQLINYSNMIKNFSGAFDDCKKFLDFFLF